MDAPHGCHGSPPARPPSAPEGSPPIAPGPATCVSRRAERPPACLGTRHRPSPHALPGNAPGARHPHPPRSTSLAVRVRPDSPCACLGSLAVCRQEPSRSGGRPVPSVLPFHPCPLEKETFSREPLRGRRFSVSLQMACHPDSRAHVRPASSMQPASGRTAAGHTPQKGPVLQGTKEGHPVPRGRSPAARSTPVLALRSSHPRPSPATGTRPSFSGTHGRTHPVSKRSGASLLQAGPRIRLPSALRNPCRHPPSRPRFRFARSLPLGGLYPTERCVPFSRNHSGRRTSSLLLPPSARSSFLLREQSRNFVASSSSSSLPTRRDPSAGPTRRRKEKPPVNTDGHTQHPPGIQSYSRSSRSFTAR